MPKIKGITLELAGVDFVVPPLPLGALESLQERIESFTGGLDKGSVATVIDCLHASLRRNYPEISREDAANLVDVANMGDVMQAVMDVSGMRRKQLEAAAAGNPQASTGAASTPALLPTQASHPT